MKFAKLFFAALLLSESIVASYAPAGANEIPGLMSKDEEIVADGYCGGNQQPIVKRPNSDEVIDHYGPCGETPLRENHPDARRLDSHHWENYYQ